MNTTPFSEKFRPKNLSECIGHRFIIDETSGILTKIIQTGHPKSLLFWGPPGTGKTTLAKIYARSFNRPFTSISIDSQISSEIKKVLEKVHQEPLIFHPTIIFIDEIHRLTKPQQDLLLKGIEVGEIILIAATTENPSFTLTHALLSRIQVLTLKPLTQNDLETLFNRIQTQTGKYTFDPDAKQLLITQAAGDARKLLQLFEHLSMIAPSNHINKATLETLLPTKAVGLDPQGESRYTLISALHKAVRGSDCQAALYWFSRQVSAGEDLKYIGRRLIRMAAEDIGLADPQALSLAQSAFNAYEKMGSPEGDLLLAEVVVYLALAPKSNSLYTAYNEALSFAEKTQNTQVPMHLVNAPTKWMKKEGYGKEYIYEHDYTYSIADQNFWPDGIHPQTFYQPRSYGFERDLEKRIEFFSKKKQETKKEAE